MTREEEQRARDEWRQRRIRQEDYRHKRSLVYFARSESGGPIKIGASYRPMDRIRAFQPWCPYRLVLLAVMPGSQREERKLHQRFAAERLHSEWFTPSEELLTLIQSLRQPLCIHCGYPVERNGDECSECKKLPRKTRRNGSVYLDPFWAPDPPPPPWVPRARRTEEATVLA